jgi:hypothetical protein
VICWKFTRSPGPSPNMSARCLITGTVVRWSAAGSLQRPHIYDSSNDMLSCYDMIVPLVRSALQSRLDSNDDIVLRVRCVCNEWSWHAVFA